MSDTQTQEQTTETKSPPAEETTGLGGTTEETPSEKPTPSQDSGETKAEPGLGDEPGEEAPPTNEYHGAPEADYELPTAPDGFTVDAEELAKFSPIAKELGLSQKGLQRLVDIRAEMVQAETQNWQNLTKDWSKTWRSDPEIGGTNTTETLRTGNAALAKFGDAELRSFLQKGFGNHPAVVRFFSKVGKAFGEPEPGAGAPSERKLSRAEKFYGPD